MVIALGWTLRCNIDGLHIPSVCLDSGKGHPCTFDARRPLYGVDTWHRISKPPHQAEIAIQNRLNRPQLKYDVLHGSARHPVKLGPLGHLFIRQQRAF